MRALVMHPGATVSTHDVFMGILDGLRDGGHAVSVYPLDVRLAASAMFLSAQRDVERAALGMELGSPSEVEIQLQASEGVLVRAALSKVDWVIVVSGMFVPLAVMQMLRHFGDKLGFRTALVLTESPYDEAMETRWSQHAHVTFSNERTTAARLGAVYLPHAWRKGAHDVAIDRLPAMPAHDCVFVGTGFVERIQWLTRFVEAGAPLSLYGTWPVEDASVLRACVQGEGVDAPISNLHAASLYARAGASLNLYRTSRGATGFTSNPVHVLDAESLNPRAYELAALGCPYVSEPRAEVAEVFGDLVPQTSDPAEAARYVQRFAAMTAFERAAYAKALRTAVAEHHWLRRVQVITDALDAA